jgi:hypothetical protein
MTPGTLFLSFAGRWSELGDASGINMYVAKNATHHYTSWWYIQRMADFDYADSSDPDLEGHGMMEKVDRQTLPDDARDADANVCLELFTTDAETDCFLNSNEISDGDYDWDDDDNVQAGVLMSAMVFSVFGFLAIVLFGVLILKEVRQRNSSAGVVTTSTTTSNELHKDKL